MRRDHPKYLNLILAVTFLYQLQRPVHTDDELGEYIETTLDDLTIANELAHQLFGHSLDDLSRPGRELLRLTYQYVQRRAGGKIAGHISFNRRELREAFKWGDTRLRTHLDELVEMEYALPLSGRNGQTYQYRLLYEPEQHEQGGKFLAGIKSVEQIRREANLAGILPHPAGKNGHPAPTLQVEKRGVRNGAKADEQRALPLSPANLAPFSGERVPETQPIGGQP